MTRLAPASALALALAAPAGAAAEEMSQGTAQTAGAGTGDFAPPRHLPEESGHQEPPAANPADAPGPSAACHPPQAPYRSVVTQTRAPQSAGEEVIDAQAIAIAPRRRAADDLLRLVPGVWLSQHGAEGKGQQIFLRGFDAAHGTDVAVSVAGVPINELSNIHGHGYIDLGFVIPEVVRRIAVRKGPFRAQDGTFATAGAIDLELGVAAEQRGARVSYQLGSTGRHRGLALLAPRRRALDRSFLALEAMHDRGFGERREARRLATMGQLQLHESPEVGAIDLLASGYVAGFATPGALRVSDVDAGLVPFDGASRDDTGGRSIRGLTALRHRRQGRGRLDHQLHAQLRQLELTEDFTGYLLDPVHGDRRLQSHRSLGGGYRLAHTLPLGERLALLTGLAWTGERLDQFEDAVAADHGVVARRWDLRVDQHQVAGHAAVRYAPTRWLTAEGGARVDLFHYTVVDRLAADGAPPARRLLAWPSPRLSLRLRVAPRLHLFAAHGRGLRAPEARSVLAEQAGLAAQDPDQSRYRGGEARVTPSDTVELGARLQARRVSAGAALFGTWIARELIYDHVSGINLEQNATRRLGGELDLRVRPRPWIELRSELTLVHARFVASGAPVPNAPPILWSAQATAFHRSGLSGSARVWVLGPRPLPHGARAGTVALVDVSASYRIDRLQLDLQIDNLLNARWREGEYNYASWFDRAQPRSAIPVRHGLAGPPLTVRLGATLWL